MDVARALSFDLPSTSMVPQEKSLLPVGNVDEEIEITDQLVDPYPENEVVEEPFEQCFAPSVGMEFDSIDDAYNFYNHYGFKTGFSIRRAQKYHSQTGEKKVISQRFVCSKEGLSKRQKQERIGVGISPNEKTPQKAISFRRTSCKASLSVSLQSNGKWLVTTFKKEHNHELVQSPSKKRYFKSHTHIRDDQKECISLLSNQNVAPAKIFEAIVEKEGGRHNVLFSKKQLTNEIAKENRKLVGVDVKKALEYFKMMQETDPDFFFEVEPDDNQTVKNIFWIDGRSRRSYQAFGDVLVFDTTYNTNRYYMPCSPFIGVNHHWLSIFFGCALIRAEGADTFKWLFQTFLKAMNGKHPKGIITDQDPAMRVAIADVFPNTTHRCCQWHVMRKARDNLGLVYGKIKGLEDDLQSCISLSLTIEEFEKGWKDMLEKYNMQDNKHLDLMFRTREKWVPAYFRGTFFADMSTSQRSESANAVLKLWTDSHTSIYKFVMQFSKMVEGIFAKEDEEDFRSCTEQPQLWSFDPIEVEARRVYTRKIYSLFKNLFRQSTSFNIHEVEKDALYEVKRIHDPTTSNWKICVYQVRVNKANTEISCNCRGFEFQGLLCSHSLKIMQNLGMRLHPRYVLQRWTKEANEGLKKSQSDIRSVEAIRSDAER
ncbi:protein FAR1-RELATED SEQUENCE 5-like [Carex rostrata]